jgi:hypothetical protein
MHVLGHLLRISLGGRRAIAVTTGAKRTLARVVLEAGRPYRLLMARAVRNELYLVSACSYPEALRFAHQVGQSLRGKLALPSPFPAPHVVPLQSRQQLCDAFWRGVRPPPASRDSSDPFGEASNLPDLLGLRLVGRHTVLCVERLLPRVARTDLARSLGVTLHQLTAGPISSRALEQLADAAAAAVAAPDLDGLSRQACDARRAAVRLAGPALSVPRIAGLLRCSDRSVRGLAKQPADPLLVEAIVRQLRLRSAPRTPPPPLATVPATLQSVAPVRGPLVARVHVPDPLSVAAFQL